MLQCPMENQPRAWDWSTGLAWILFSALLHFGCQLLMMSSLGQPWANVSSSGLGMPNAPILLVVASDVMELSIGGAILGFAMILAGYVKSLPTQGTK